MASNLPFRPGWPWTPEGLLDSASRVLGLNLCATTASQNFEVVWKLYVHFLKKEWMIPQRRCNTGILSVHGHWNSHILFTARHFSFLHSDCSYMSVWPDSMDSGFCFPFCGGWDQCLHKHSLASNWIFSQGWPGLLILLPPVPEFWDYTTTSGLHFRND